VNGVGGNSFRAAAAFEDLLSQGRHDGSDQPTHFIVIVDNQQLQRAPHWIAIVPVRAWEMNRTDYSI